MTLQEFHKMLSGIDWTYEYSDSAALFRRWRDETEKARVISAESPSHADLFAAFKRGERPPFPDQGKVA